MMDSVSVMNGDILPVGAKNRLILCLVSYQCFYRLLLFTTGHIREMCLQSDSLVSSVFGGGRLFANRLALIDEDFASAGKLDGCGLLLLYIQQKQLWEEEQSVLTQAKVLEQSVVLHYVILYEPFNCTS